MAEKLRKPTLKTLGTGFLRILTSSVFLAAGVLKLRDPDAVLVAVYQYKLLSWQASGMFATYLPYLEITTALCLWIPRLRLGASLLSIGLYVLFITALASAVARNLDVSCGCFGTTDLYPTAVPRLLEDLVLLATCLPLWFDAAAQHSALLQSSPESGN
jgi:uncharacterized membrane protein YphA (DoxX/SURF4 family)